MDEFSKDVERQAVAISWQGVVDITIFLVVTAKCIMFGVTPLDMLLAQGSFASYIVRDWRVGRMTPDRWKAFWQITAINLCVIAFMCL